MFNQSRRFWSHVSAIPAGLATRAMTQTGSDAAGEMHQQQNVRHGHVTWIGMVRQLPNWLLGS